MLRTIQQSQRKINATVVGSPTISNPDNISSNFTQENAGILTNSNYLQIPNISVATTSSFTLHLKLKFDFTNWEYGSKISYYIFGQEYYFDLYVYSLTRRLRIEFGNKSNWYKPTVNEGITTLVENQWYYVKIAANQGTGFSVYISTDNVNWTQEINVSNSNTLYFYPNLALGRFIANTFVSSNVLRHFLDGKIDMNETYLEVDNKIVWKGVK